MKKVQEERIAVALEGILDLLEGIREEQRGQRVVLVELSRDVQQLRASVTDQTSRQGQELARQQKRLIEHDLRLFNLEEVKLNGAE